jgi:hypothetical protein
VLVTRCVNRRIRIPIGLWDDMDQDRRLSSAGPQSGGGSTLKTFRTALRRVSAAQLAPSLRAFWLGSAPEVVLVGLWGMEAEQPGTPGTLSYSRLPEEFGPSRIQAKSSTFKIKPPAFRHQRYARISILIGM